MVIRAGMQVLRRVTGQRESPVAGGVVKHRAQHEYGRKCQSKHVPPKGVISHRAVRCENAGPQHDPAAPRKLLDDVG